VIVRDAGVVKEAEFRMKVLLAGYVVAVKPVIVH
jgi:hypothetical protein